MKVTKDTVALLTGGANGIGAAVADALLKLGCGVVILVDRDEKTGKALAASLSSSYPNQKTEFKQVDVTNDKQLDSVFSETASRFGRLDIVFNNAGITERSLISDAKSLSGHEMPNDWTSTIDINLRAVINGTRLAVRELTRRKQAGVIINTASLGGLHGMPLSPVYCATKHAVVGFCRSLKHLRSSGIRVNALCPGFTDTAMVREGLALLTAANNVVSSSGATSVPLSASQSPVTAGLLTVGNISRAFVMLVEDEKFAGSVVSITRELGITQHFTMPLVENKLQQVLAKL